MSSGKYKIKSHEIPTVYKSGLNGEGLQNSHTSHKLLMKFKILQLLGWSKCSFGFFHRMLKNSVKVLAAQLCLTMNKCMEVCQAPLSMEFFR